MRGEKPRETLLSSPEGALLSQGALDSTVATAIQRWQTTGLSNEQVASLHKLKFEVVDLPDLRLGEANGNHIRVDSNAGGNGWFIDVSARERCSLRCSRGR